MLTYVVIDGIYQEFTSEYIEFHKNVNYLILSNNEIITINIVGNLLYIDSKKDLFNFFRKNSFDLFSNSDIELY